MDNYPQPTNADPEGSWYVGTMDEDCEDGPTYGPFATEADAERVADDVHSTTEFDTWVSQ